MVQETILQHWIISKFALPFLLVFFIVFAILEKTKVLGENKQLNAFLSFVIGIIFVSAIDPKLIVSNLILFFTVSIVVMFIGLLLWSFFSGGESKFDQKSIKIIGGVLIVIALFIGVLWASGTLDNFYDFWLSQDWSGSFWINLIFIIVIAFALAVAIKSTKNS
jgi:hypothetical protein